MISCAYAEDVTSIKLVKRAQGPNRPQARAYRQFLRHRREAREGIIAVGPSGDPCAPCPCVKALRECHRLVNGPNLCVCNACRIERDRAEGGEQEIVKQGRAARINISKRIGSACIREGVAVRELRQQELDAMYRQRYRHRQARAAEIREHQGHGNGTDNVVLPEQAEQVVMRDRFGNEVVDVRDYHCDSFNSRLSDDQAYVTDAFQDFELNDENTEGSNLENGIDCPSRQDYERPSSSRSSSSRQRRHL